MKDNCIDEFEWFDEWCDLHYELIEHKKYPELVEHCRKRFERDPQDEHGVEALAEALVLNKQYQESIDMLTPRYMKDPEHPLYEHAILDALFGMGKSTEDFSWKLKPKVSEISQDTLNVCFDYLKPKRKPRSVSDMYIMFIIGGGYVRFTEDELFQALIDDKRFYVSCDNVYEEGISIVRKQEK